MAETPDSPPPLVRVSAVPSAQRPTPLAKGVAGKTVKQARRVYIVNEDDLEDQRPTPEEEASKAAEERAKADQAAQERRAKEVEAAHRSLDAVIADSELWAGVKPKRPIELVIHNDAEMACIANFRPAVVANNAHFVQKFQQHVGKFLPPPPKSKK
jgi:hypothetical protein